jgi:REP element-mobilizing transposase RayT
MARSRYRFGEPDYPHFLTATVLEWLPVFTRQETVDILFDSWRYLQEHHQLRLYGFVILENHLHVVAQGDNLPATWARFKSYTARRLIDYLRQHRLEQFLKYMRSGLKARREDRVYQFWQEGSHPQVIEGREMLVQKLAYIHQNPVKRGYVDEPEHWRWSSARNYAGMESPLQVFMDW